MNSRKRSVITRTRRESTKNLFGRPKTKESTNSTPVNDTENRRSYSDLNVLKINEADLLTANNRIPSLRCVNFRAAVRRLIPESERVKLIEGFVLKKLPYYQKPSDIELFSSINSNRRTYEEEIRKEERLKVIAAKKATLRSYHVPRQPLPDVKGNSFEALENWKRKMFERRKLKDSLSNKLQRLSTELLMSQSGNTITKSTQQDHLLKAMLPFFQPGTGAPLMRSIWPELEVTRTELQIFKNKWKPEVPLQIPSVGCPDEIINEMDESNEIPRKVSNKEDILKDPKFQDFFREHLYKNPEYKDLIVMGRTISNVSATKSDDLDTPQNSVLENSMIKSQITIDNFGPEMIVNHELLFRQSSDLEDENSSETDDVIQIEFLTTKIGALNSKELLFANTGSCVIHYRWKKLEIVKQLQTDQTKTVFFFKRNDGLILPNSNLQLPITFKSTSPGFFDEEWEFITKPNLSKTKILFHFHAIAIRPDDSFLQREIISEEIFSFNKFQVVKEIIDDICNYATNVTVVETYEEVAQEKIDNEERFNQQNNIGIWNFDTMTEIEFFSKEAFTIEWDFSLHNLKEMVYVCDVENNNSESLLSKYLDLCQKVSLPNPIPRFISNDLLNSPNDIQIICSAHLLLAIDESIEMMNKLSGQLGIKRPELETYLEHEASSGTVILDENMTTSSRGKKTVDKPPQIKKEEEVKNDDLVVEIDDLNMTIRKKIFGNRSKQIVRHIMCVMVDKIDRLIKF